ncbi:hypothetical protein BC829DRAFT_398100 [Chytridium lagenaria]|nr:hypothetical protein BC829DRAFT_398100 [Chytridium lagenaria]
MMAKFYIHPDTPRGPIHNGMFQQNVQEPAGDCNTEACLPDITSQNALKEAASIIIREKPKEPTNAQELNRPKAKVLRKATSMSDPTKIPSMTSTSSQTSTQIPSRPLKTKPSISKSATSNSASKDSDVLKPKKSALPTRPALDEDKENMVPTQCRPLKRALSGMPLASKKLKTCPEVGSIFMKGRHPLKDITNQVGPGKDGTKRNVGSMPAMSALGNHENVMNRSNIVAPKASFQAPKAKTTEMKPKKLPIITNEITRKLMR